MLTSQHLEEEKEKWVLWEHMIRLQQYNGLFTLFLNGGDMIKSQMYSKEFSKFYTLLFAIFEFFVYQSYLMNTY